MKKPTRKECMQAWCWECLGHYSDGKQDCENVRCPNYEYMPYRELEPDYWWRVYNTKRRGKQLKTAPSEEQVRRGRALAKLRNGA